MPMQLSRILSFQEKGKETLCLKHKSHVSCLLKHSKWQTFLKSTYFILAVKSIWLQLCFAMKTKYKIKIMYHNLINDYQCFMSAYHHSILYYNVMSYPLYCSYCSWGFQGKNTEVVCHSLLQWTTFCQISPPWPVRLGLPHGHGLVSLS